MVIFWLLVVALALISIRPILNYMLRREAVAQLSQFAPKKAEIESSVVAFQSLLSSDAFIANFDYKKWLDATSEFAAFDKADLSSVVNDPLAIAMVQLRTFRLTGRSLIASHNAVVTKKEIEYLKPILHARGIPGNEEQLIAAVSQEDSTLVVAGAGTGKTTTILGKLAYLTDRIGVNPEDILVLSFTKKVVDELADRITTKLPDRNFDVRTFHSFGLSVISNAMQTKPAIFDPEKRAPWIESEFDKLLAANADYLRAAVHFFAYHLQFQDVDERFASMDEYYKYIRTKAVITFQKEKVKSYQEAMIANFLFLNGVNYIYEADYKYPTADKQHRQYAPDFYLPEHDIYLEHFGIDREGNVHFTDDQVQNTIAGIKYREGMEWKRNLHANMHTNLIETFSYEFTEQTWEDLLKQKLAKHGVDLAPRPMGDVIKTLQDSEQIREIVNLFATFLDLTKSNHYSEAKLREIIDLRNRPREIAFGRLFLPLYQKYEDFLAVSGKIDFHDMLNQASELIQQKRYVGAHKYIIIDEFQDFSVSKDIMVRALCQQNPGIKLFCVGDDWQSIYRFAGADVTLMTHFEKYHGYTNNLRLVRTNRFDKKLAMATNQFILKNPSQIKKEIQASHELSFQPASIVKTKSQVDSGIQIASILDTLNNHVTDKKQRVYLLGRYGFNKPLELEQWRRQFKNLHIEFITAHSSKGLEADAVIVLDVVGGKYGFPSQIADDPVLSLVLSDSEGYPHAEERRLMYVALTRTRGKVFVITRIGNESVFIPELEKLIKIRYFGS